MEFKYNENLIPYLYEGVYVVDKKRKIIFWNEGSERITGYTSDEVTNSFCYHNILQHIDETGKQLCFNGCPLQKTLNDGMINEARVYLKHKDGYRIPVMVKTLPIRDEMQNIVAAIEVFTDERFQKQIYHENQELKDKLRIDPLTQIANRHFFDFQLSKKLEEAKVFANPFGILMIDIDYFKQVNDTYGHLVGDEILKIVAKSLSSNIEKTDLVSRWGGEEFIVLVDVTSIDDLLKIAERLRRVVEASSYHFENGKTIQVTISIGGTLAKPEDSAKTLIARADENMYFAKQNGRNQSKIS
ncbi:sensor domain-containing diguanylate cyclase [Peloplasma aerotolerans]|uniref:Sensor domain-containing diguanylate cyclase n=1 Tax=Peloplasma aerotolerans TaxID=3044389 RepID=A0AAW6U761_9MOLU|nr:sensor domain-containing diguanylate cyclase [Mariniplasma sp. M4Ah]MDI6453801.1 sensor domain-containing diguanylate cyclase [Mariniplasma sp. M4Ah]